MNARIACLAGTLATAACAAPPGSEGCGEIPCGSERAFSRTFQYPAAPQVDLLFVIDDTPAIAPYVDKLRQNLPAFGALFTPPWRALSLNARFVRAALSAPDCAPPGSRAAVCGLRPGDDFAHAPDCTSASNFSAPLEETFGCLGDFGATACGAPQPLEAVRRALTAGGDFLRADAYLMIVIIAGADDASTTAGEPTPVETYVDFIKGLKPDPANQVLVSTIAPVPVAPRLHQATLAFGRNGVYEDIAGDAPLRALTAVENYVGRSVEPICLYGVRDKEPSQAEIQAECVVEERLTAHDGTVISETELPACTDDSPTPCWRVFASSPCSGDGWSQLYIDRGAEWCALYETTTRVTCLGCLDPRDPACARSGR